MSAPEGSSAATRAFRIDAIASGFVAALALAVSTYNVYLQREQIRAQVWPHLEWTYSEHYAASDGHFDLNVANTGVGPALIGGVRTTVDGKPVKHWSEALTILVSDPELDRAINGPTSHLESSRQGFAGRVLGAGVERQAFRFVGTRPEDKDVIHRAYDRIAVEVCYCSTLGECWIYPSERPVKSCPTDGFTFED